VPLSGRSPSGAGADGNVPLDCMVSSACAMQAGTLAEVAGHRDHASESGTDSAIATAWRTRLRVVERHDPGRGQRGGDGFAFQCRDRLPFEMGRDCPVGGTD
jgi:hypothetical protein